MAIYIYLYVMGLFFSLIKNKFFYMFFSLFLIGILGLRGVYVGVDTERYYENFTYISQGAYPNKDLIYYYINYLFYSLGFNAESVMLYFAAVTILPILYVIYKKSPYPVLSFAVFFALGFYAFYFNGMRQGASMSLGLLAFFLLTEGKKNQFFVFLTLACVTHLSAIFIFIGILIIRMRFNCFLLLAVSLWIASVYSALFGDLFIFILNKVSFVIPQRFLGYVVEGELNPKGFSFIFDQILFLFLFFMLPFIKNKSSHSLVRVGIVGILCLHFFSGVLYMDRLALFFYVFLVVSVPLAISYIASSRVRFIVICLLLFLFSIQFLYRISLNPHDIVPYQFIYD